MRGLGQRVDPVEPGEAAARRRDRALAEVDDPAERLERPDELQQQRVEERELPEREVAVDHEVPAEVRAPRRSRASAGTAGRAGRRLDAGLPHRLVAYRAGAQAEAVAHVVLAAERLHHLDADDGLVGRLRDVGLALLHHARDRRHQVREAPRQVGDGGHRDAGADREERVDDQEDDGGADDHHRALAHLDHAPADEVAHRVEVVRRARDDLAGRVPVVERARVGQVRREQPAAHLVLDLDADARGHVAPLVVDDEPGQGERGDAEQVRPQLVGAPRHDRVVDRALHQQGHRERRGRDPERREQAERGQPPLVGPQPEEAARGRAERQIGWVVGVVCHESRGMRGGGVDPGVPSERTPTERVDQELWGREAVAQRGAGTPRPAVSRACVLSGVAKMSLPSGVRAATEAR